MVPGTTLLWRYFASVRPGKPQDCRQLHRTRCAGSTGAFGQHFVLAVVPMLTSCPCNNNLHLVQFNFAAGWGFPQHGMRGAEISCRPRLLAAMD